MRNLIIIFLLAFCYGFEALSIEPLSPKIDSISFNSGYIDKLKGIESFKKGKSTNSIFHLEKYIARNPYDYEATDYLYGSYIQMNQMDFAKYTYQHLSEYNQTIYTIKPKSVSSLYAEGGLLHIGKCESFAAKERDLKSGPYVLVMLNHDLNSAFSYRHHFSFYNIFGEQSVFTDHGIEGKEVNDVQICYAGTINCCNKIGVNTKFSGAYFVDKSTYNRMSRDFKRLRTYEIENNNFALQIGVKKTFDWFHPSVTGTYARIAGTNYWQPKLTIYVYPLQNLNFYNKIHVSSIISAENRVIFGETIGGKLFDWLWMEASFDKGNLQNYCEEEFISIYSNSNKSQYRISSDLIFPLSSRVTVNFLYQLLRNEIVNPFSNNPTFNTHKFIGGIKCAF